MIDKKKELFDEKQFQKEIDKAEYMYFSWPSELHCPAFNEKVKITRTGWNHFIQKRSRKQKYWRAKQFLKAKKIIEKTTTIQRETVYFDPIRTVRIWSFISIEEGSIIQVDIREVDKQQKHFFSLVYKGVSPKVVK